MEKKQNKTVVDLTDYSMAEPHGIVTANSRAKHPPPSFIKEKRKKVRLVRF